MPCQLPADCLNVIFEFLKDKVDLRSCLLVNRLWCEVSVQILWKSIQNYNTLIACLPNESKEILYENEITITTPTSQSPLFNYVTFIKRLSIYEIVENIPKIYQPIVSQSLDNNKKIILQEIFKMFINQISLKTLDLFYDSILAFHSISNFIQNIPFTTYPGAIDCLSNLSELTCYSDLTSEFFYLLSQTCHNIQSLSIFLVVERGISNGLPDFISIQQDLKYLRICNDHNREDFMGIISTYLHMCNDYGCENLTEIISSLAKLLIL